MLVSGRVRQRQSSSAAEFGLKNQRTKKRMEVRRRLLRQVRSDVSGTNVTRRFLVPRAGRAGVVVSPCQKRCSAGPGVLSYEHNTQRWSATVSVETDAETRPAWVTAGGLLHTSTRSRWYVSSGCGARRSPRARERARPTPMMALGLLPFPLPGSSRLGSPRPSSYHILEYKTILRDGPLLD